MFRFYCRYKSLSILKSSQQLMLLRLVNQIKYLNIFWLDKIPQHPCFNIIVGMTLCTLIEY